MGTTMLHVRIDEETKDKAAKTLAAMGLSVSDAVRVFLRRIADEKGLPLSLRVPNAETLVAMCEAEGIVRQHDGRCADAVESIDDLEKPGGR